MYPCTCSPCENCTTYPECPSGNCLRVPSSVVIAAETSVLPCGAVGLIDIGALSTLTACTGTITWAVFNTWSTVAFSAVSINSSGVLSVTTTEDAVPGTFYTIEGLVTCSNSMLSSYFSVQVPIKVGCYNVLCPEDERCNACTGECIPAVPDVILT